MTHALPMGGTTYSSYALSVTTSCTASTMQDDDVSSTPTATFYILSDEALTPPTFKPPLKAG